MEKIKELFQKDIRRKIEEVIKVDQADEDTVKNELDEYIVTDSIKDYYIHMLDEYNASRKNPSEGIGVWISGFFGSGKSSFAKILGYILSARLVKGESSAKIFADRAQNEKISNLLKVINPSIPAYAVIFDVSMDRGVRTANERIVEVMYKALLRDLGYSEDFDLAALEMTLEEKKELEEFKKLYELKYKKPWDKSKKIPARAVSEASRIRHEMDSETYPSADSWAKSLGENGREDIDANRFAERSFELMDRRKPGHALIFVIDEVGQYVSRSVDKMLDLQAVVQAFGKVGKNRVKAEKAIAPTWIIVTSQEKLDEVVNLLDSSRVELARLKDRFPISIDLEPTDISEITQKRVLQKTPEAERVLSNLYDNVQGRLNTYTKLHGSNINTTITKSDFINFYPYLPQYIDLSIDIISGIRLQPGAQRHVGGSNRTIIKQAQQMLVNEKVNLANKPIGTLVTIDKIYDLVEGNLSTEKRKDIFDIEKRFDDNPYYVKVAKAICLLEFTKKVSRSAQNIAAVLYDDINAESNQLVVDEAIKALEKARYIKSTDEGYKLQSLKERDWDQERKSIDVLPGNKNKIKRIILNEIFSDYKINTYRYKTKTFKIGCIVDGIPLDDEGDIPIRIIIADDSSEQPHKSQETREKSREPSNKNDIFLLITLTDELHNLIEDVYRSEEMINKYERLASQGKLNPDDQSSLADEKRRKDSLSRELKSKLNQALTNGKIYFQGFENDNTDLGKELPDILKKFLDDKILSLYTKLEMGAMKLKGDEAEKILTAINLNGLPQIYYDGDEKLGLVTKQADKYVINISAPISQEIISYITQRYSYGEKTTGKDIEDHFKGFGYGWERDVIKVVLAALFRAGAIEVTYQGRRYTNYTDPISRQQFTNNTAFKTSAFTPKKLIDSKTLANAARNYEDITGNEVDVEEGAIAQAFKHIASTEKENVISIRALISAYNLPGKEFVQQYSNYIDGILDSAPDDCVKLLANEGKSFKESLEKISKLKDSLTESTLRTIKLARAVLDQKYPILQSYDVLSDDLKIKKQDLEQELNADSFYERIADIAQNERIISKTYSDIYQSKHKARDEVYSNKFDEIKGLPEWANIGDKKDLIANTITSKICLNIDEHEYFVPFDDISMQCSKCHSSIAQIDSDISAASSIKKKVMEKLTEITKPEAKIEHVLISAYFGTSITTKDELKAGLDKLKDNIEKLLNEGKIVILE
jgi:hypothetical protein